VIVRVIHIEPNKIIIKDRFRRDLGDIENLEKSIKMLGLLQPIGITKENRLIWGWRRLQAWKKVKGREPIPAIIFPEELSKVAELAENICRLELPWHVKDVAIAELHRMMERKVKVEFLPAIGKKLRGRPPKPWTQEDTAEVLGISQQRVSLAIQMAEALEKYPELKKLETEREAIRMFRRLEKIIREEPKRWTCNACGSQFGMEESKSIVELCPTCYAEFLTWRAERGG